MRLTHLITLSLTATLALAACAPVTTQPRQVLRLATTTSTADSGLLEAILPDFEQRFNARVDVVALGTGQALELGANGDADVVLVHARAREDKFVADGLGINRREVMYNDFILVGPKADPASLNGLTSAKQALAALATAGAPFASRGDDSGTHSKEKSLWASAGLTPTAALPWYLSVGQGMGETLLFANERGAYTLTDRGTWLAQAAKLPNLMIVVGGNTLAENQDIALRNPYGVIPVNPERHTGINAALAEQFAVWLTSAEVQAQIAEYGKDQFGQALFYPNAQK